MALRPSFQTLTDGKLCWERRGTSLFWSLTPYGWPHLFTLFWLQVWSTPWKSQANIRLHCVKKAEWWLANRPSTLISRRPLRIRASSLANFSGHHCNLAQAALKGSPVPAPTSHCYSCGGKNFEEKFMGGGKGTPHKNGFWSRTGSIRKQEHTVNRWQVVVVSQRAAEALEQKQPDKSMY